MKRNHTLMLIAGTCFTCLPLTFSLAREPEPKPQPAPTAPTLASAAAAPAPAAAPAEPANPADAPQIDIDRQVLNHTVSTGNARGRFQFNHVPLTVPEAQGIYVKAHAPRYRHRSGGIHAAGEQHHRLFL